MPGEGHIWETRLLREGVRQERRSLAGGRNEAGNLGFIPRPAPHERNLVVIG